MGRGSSKVGGGKSHLKKSESFYEREKRRIETEMVKKDGTLSALGKRELDRLEFQNYRFSGLEWREASNKYYGIKQYNKNADTAIIRVDDSHLIQTKYGYGFKTDADHVVWLKDWQVNQNWHGNYVLANKKYWKETKSKYSDDNLMSYDKKNSNRLDTFEKVKSLAKEQSDARNGEEIRWEMKGSGKFGKGGRWG